MSEPYLSEDRPARYRTIVLQALARLSAGDRDPATLHRARTHLRRLQAYLELVGEDRNAEAIARCVTRLSKLRTLQVFVRYLAKLDAPRSDRKAATRCMRARCRKLEGTHAYATIARIVRRHAVPPTPANPEWLAERMQALRHAHAKTFRGLIAEAGATPRRKILHRLRLLIKSIRYQEEWAVGRPYAQPALIQRLKHAQRVLGEYEDLFQFRKLARSLNLRSSSVIKQSWRRARKRARAIPPRLAEHLDLMAGQRIRLVGAHQTSGHLAG